MAFFQNPFFEEFRGTWPLGDRSAMKPWVIKGNSGRGFDVVKAWNKSTGVDAGFNGIGTYDLTGSDANGANGELKANLTIRFAYRDFTRFVALTIDVSGTVVAATTPVEIVTALNADGLFSTYFTASLGLFSQEKIARQIIITSKKPGQVKFFIENSGAEETLNFNQKAGVADLPTYLARHTVDNLVNYGDSLGSLIQLSFPFITNITVAAPAVVTYVDHGLVNNDLIDVARSDSVVVIDGNNLVVTRLTDDTFTCTKDVAGTAGNAGILAKPVASHIIENALDSTERPLGLTLASSLFDWELLNGNSPVYVFKRQTVELIGVNSRILLGIEYPAGSGVGDLGVRKVYTYTGNNLLPDTVAEYPHTLTAADLITP